MDRRNFIQKGLAIVAASQLPDLGVFASATTKRSSKDLSPEKEGPLKLRFLGTGAADWSGMDERGELRRLSSVLLDDSVLIDFTRTAFDMVPEGVVPEAIFYTHSHPDHYNPGAALKVGVRRVYLGETWVERGRKDFREAASALGMPLPEIIPLAVGDSVVENGIRFTALPANHATEDLGEQTLLYLVEKRNNRLLYATDTGGIPSIAARLSGIDAHIQGKPITALIMEATMGLGYDEDYRLFTHSSVSTVLRTWKVLSQTGRYAPTEGQPVWLTHLARTLHGTQAELDATLPPPLKAAYDGLTIILDA